MHKRSLVLLTFFTFLAFLALLSIGISISAQDKASALETRIEDLEYQIER